MPRRKPEQPRGPSNRDRFFAHMQGFQDAVGVHPVSLELSRHDDATIRDAYTAGWHAGRDASKAEQARAEGVYGYTQAVFKLV